MGFTMSLNLLLLLAMVATNILSLYHLSTTMISTKPPTTPTPPVPDHLIHQLQTIRATITHLTRHQSNPSIPTTTSSTIPSELLLYTQLSPIASACRHHPDLLHQYMNYTPFATCPPPSSAAAEPLILRGCHPLPRRRCFSGTPNKQPTSLESLPANPFSPVPEYSILWNNYKCKSFDCLNPDMGFDLKKERSKLLTYKTELDLPISQLTDIARKSKTVIRLALDIGGGTGTFAAQMKEHNVTVVTTTMSLGAPYNEVAALRGLVPLHVPLQQRLPVFDGVLDLVRCGHAVNRWIPVQAMEFLFYDVDRVLRGGGFFWVDRFFSKGVDLDKVYAPLIGKLGYKTVKWAVGKKTDSSGVKNGEVYLTALLQKPLSR